MNKSNIAIAWHEILAIISLLLCFLLMFPPTIMIMLPDITISMVEIIKIIVIIWSIGISIRCFVRFYLNFYCLQIKYVLF